MSKDSLIEIIDTCMKHRGKNGFEPTLYNKWFNSIGDDEDPKEVVGRLLSLLNKVE